MRTMFVFIAMMTAAAAEPARWSVDVHDRVGVYSRSTRIDVRSRSLTIACEVFHIGTRKHEVVRARIEKPARGLADGRPRVCGSGAVGPVCVDVPAPGELTTTVQTDHPACARGTANVSTGD